MEAVMGVANAMGDMVVNERLTVDGVDVLVGYANEGDQHVTENLRGIRPRQARRLS